LNPPPAVKVYFSPNGGCTEAIVAQINNANTSIDVMAYYFTSTPIAAALRQAHLRGVKVRVVLDRSQQTGLYSVGTYLTNAGIPVRVDHAHQIAHNKVMVIDKSITITGSFNFTKSADERNAENLLIINDQAIAKLYSDNWLIHWNHSQPYARSP
jgi:phosphatidylserine/phosphatidylglycerophosphate/cardiolipin synthase-like enzyme